MRGSFVALLATLAGLSLSGCAGYQLGPAKPAYLSKVQSISVPTFRSEVLEPRAETLVTSSVIKEFQRDGTYRIAPEGRGDATLLGTIESLERTPVRTVRGNVLQPAEFVLEMKIRFELREGGKDGRVIDGGRVSGTASFFASTDLTQDQRQAIPRAAEQAAARLTGQLSEGF
ncbi:MAG: hypothetical protein JSR82_21505 [Verrucomicrobia bacterium]|nr:hypothetical protein [Verrucomicrobiota bacterium]